jgi:hypothetical protein
MQMSSNAMKKFQTSGKSCFEWVIQAALFLVAVTMFLAIMTSPAAARRGQALREQENRHARCTQVVHIHK